MRILPLKVVDPRKFLSESYLRLSAVCHPLIRSFQQKLKIEFDKGNFKVKTVNSSSELEEVLQLRYEIFHREFQGKRFPIGLDVEALDARGDHLIIIDKRIGKIVGTYRLLCSLFSNVFYSQSEFQLQNFLSEPGIKLELSRAGVEKNYRNGTVMNLLWRGVAQYLFEVNAQFLFGCASIKNTSLDTVQQISYYLHTNHFASDQYTIIPTRPYKFPGFQPFQFNPNSTTNETPGKNLLPTLFATYLRMGAKVALEPALDSQFNCIDYFTLLKTKDMQRAYDKRYLRC